MVAIVVGRLEEFKTSKMNQGVGGNNGICTKILARGGLPLLSPIGPHNNQGMNRNPTRTFVEMLKSNNLKAMEVNNEEWQGNTYEESPPSTSLQGYVIQCEFESDKHEEVTTLLKKTRILHFLGWIPNEVDL